MAVSRFGVSLDKDLLDTLDKFVEVNAFANRSQAIRHVLEKYLVDEKWKCDNIVAGAVTLVYDCSKMDIVARVSEIILGHKELVLSSQNFYLDATNCMGIIALKGPSYKLTEFSDKLVAIKNLQHAKLIMSKVK